MMDALAEFKNLERPALPNATLARHESAMAATTGSSRAIAFGHARTGLVAALESAGLRRGDEVLLSPLTCKVVPLGLLHAGFKPVFVDIAHGSLNLDASRLETAMSRATRAVLFQHTYGTTSGIEATAAFCGKHALMLIEDAAQCMPHAASGAGRFGHATLYSNNLRKPLPAGSGAIVTTDDLRLAAALTRQRDALPALSQYDDWALAANSVLHTILLGPRLYWPLFGLARAFSGIYRGSSFARETATQIVTASTRPSDRQLARGEAWLRRAEAIVRQRIEACAHYAQILPPECMLRDAEWSQPLYFFPVLSPHKERMLRLAKRACLEMVAWPVRLPIYPVLQDDQMARYGYQLGSCPEAERVAQCLVGLPTDFGATQALRCALAAVVAKAAT